MIDDGIYPPRDANKMTFELWTVVHGVAALCIAKPYWSRDDVDELTDRVLRAMCCGQICTGITEYNIARDRCDRSSHEPEGAGLSASE